MRVFNVALAGAAAVGLMAAPNDANAIAYALSQLSVTNLILQGSPATPFSPTDQNGNNGFVFSGQTNASLGGVGPSNTTAAQRLDQYSSTTAFGANSSPTATACTSGGPGGGLADPCIDPLQAEVGAVSAGQNDFTAQGQSPSNFARSDALLYDTAINAHLANGNPSLVNGGDFRLIAEASVNEAALVGNTGAVTNSQKWTFAADMAAGQTVTMKFDIDAELFLLVTPDEGPLASADARWQLSFTFLQLGTNNTIKGIIGQGTNISSGNFNQDETTFSPSGTFDQASCSFSTTSGTDGDADFGSGDSRHVECTFSGFAEARYNISIAANTDIFGVTSTNIPEPASLTLLGMTLLGLGYGLRRRRTA